MNDFIVTFPVADADRRHHYCVVSAPSEHEARLRIVDRYGRAFGSVYSSVEDAGVGRYGLTEIPFGT